MNDSLINDSIVCLGCSFTYGIGANKNNENWPYYLYKLLDEKYRVINMAHGGVSLLHSVYTLEYIFKKSLRPKFIFFQVTTPYRLTLRKSPIKEKDFELVEGNFYMTGIDDIIPNSLGSRNLKWMNKYYRDRDPEKDVLWETEHKSLLVYTKHMLEKHNHCLYSQEKEKIYESFVDFSLREDAFGENYYSENVIDNGEHLSVQALQKQAEYMMTKMKILLR
jgi:hypothetical protein